MLLFEEYYWANGKPKQGPVCLNFEKSYETNKGTQTLTEFHEYLVEPWEYSQPVVAWIL